MAKTARTNQADNAGFERLERIKKLAVIAMFSDDDLMERFVLKGGNALDLIHCVSTRASLDIDLSIEADFRSDELDGVRLRIESSLKNTFQPEGYRVLDVTLEERPETVTPDLAPFWGGYRVEFKLIESAKYSEYSNDPDALRRHALMIGPRGRFQIDISKFEYCAGKQHRDLEGYRVFVYTPEMLVCEKLRAICQQMPEYGETVKRGRAGTARGRDFVDIHTLIDEFGLDMTLDGNRALLALIFKAKRVPLRLLGMVHSHRESHRPDFQVVKDSVKPGIRLRTFDFYFDSVVDLCTRLKAFGNI